MPSQPFGRSSATPPMRNQFGCMRSPQIAEVIWKAYSRSTNM